MRFPQGFGFFAFFRFEFTHFSTDMGCAYGTDVHWIYIVSAYILSNILYIIVHLFFRNDGCDNACESAAVYSADTAADLVQEQLGQGKYKRDLLLVAVLNAVAVLKQLPGRSSGLIHQLQEFLVVLLSDGIGCALYAGGLFEEMDGTKDGSVVLDLLTCARRFSRVVS